MDGFAYALLKEVKAQMEESCGNRSYQVEQGGPNVSARQFYLQQVEDNLIEPMNDAHKGQYGAGSGNELEGKMCALRSSSAMTFNILGNSRCVLKANDLGVPEGTYSVKYEHQSPTLARNGGLPANLDAWLVSDSKHATAIACEMKMMEWLTSGSSILKEAYLDATNYPEGAEDVFSSVAKQLEAEGFTRYDWPQMFKHSLALYNQMSADGYGERLRTLVLLNVVWEPANPTQDETYAKRYLAMEAEEHSEFRRFKEIMLPVRQLFLDRFGVDFRIKYRSAADFISMLDMDPARRAKLRRYC